MVNNLAGLVGLVILEIGCFNLFRRKNKILKTRAVYVSIMLIFISLCAIVIPWGICAIFNN